MTRTVESLDHLMARIVAEDRRKYDVIADTRSMNVGVRINEEGKGGAVEIDLDTPGQELRSFRLTDHTQGQVATDLGIPKRYFDRMKVDAPSLFETNVRHWMTNEPKARMIRGLTNGDGEMMTGRAWMSDKFRRLDNIEVARTLLPEFDNLGTEVVFHQAAVTEQKLHIRALFPALERDIKAVGDTVRWGISIENSEIGAGSLKLSGFVLVLACTNGMVTTKVLNVRHVGKREGEGVLSNEALAADDVAFWLAARDELRALCTESAFNTVVDQLRGLSATEVVSPVAATKVLAKEYALTEAEEEAVMLSLVQDPNGIGRGQWGMLNALTAAAKTAEGFDRQAEIEGIGWSLAQMPSNSWEKVALAVK
jgi:hypothetical protein